MDQHNFRAEAEVTRERLIKRLHASTKIATSALAYTLADCTEVAPCLSGACPMCGLRFQQAGIGLIERVITGPAQARRGRMSMATIVPAAGVVDPDSLTVRPS